MGECLLVKKGGTKEKLPTYTYTGEHQMIVDDENKGDWRIKFFTSGVFTMLSPAKLDIDVFLVGGGGAGGGSERNSWGASGGGGGGYTTTVLASIGKSIEYSIAVGAGGVGREGYKGPSGSETTAFGDTAAGGLGGVSCRGNVYTGAPGGNGGSGGGSGHGYDDGGTTGTGNGGSDGSDGNYGKDSSTASKGNGQGTTTREFGEPSGELYSGGGGGGACRATQTAGKGGSGGGGTGAQSGNPDIGGLPDNMTGRDATFYGGGGGGSGAGAIRIGATGGSGYQGICIIRNRREGTA